MVQLWTTRQGLWWQPALFPTKPFNWQKLTLSKEKTGKRDTSRWIQRATFPWSKMDNTKCWEETTWSTFSFARANRKSEASSCLRSWRPRSKELLGGTSPKWWLLASRCSRFSTILIPFKPAQPRSSLTSGKKISRHAWKFLIWDWLTPLGCVAPGWQSATSSCSTTWACLCICAIWIHRTRTWRSTKISWSGLRKCRRSQKLTSWIPSISRFWANQRKQCLNDN